jgi:heptosyltransferase-1
MRVLIVKTSSMGDVIHTLPALTDATKAIPGITFDWVVEENFAEIPAWHPAVDRVIPMAWRRWRKSLFSMTTLSEIRAFRATLRERTYDLIIDAQGLVKSAVFSRFAKGVHCGLDWSSARESWAALFYQQTCTVIFEQHAVVRARSLFSQALKYPLPEGVADYGIDRNRFISDAALRPYFVFLHGTTWATKHWPEPSWVELAKKASLAGFQIKLPWGSPAEHERALRIAKDCENAEVLSRLDLAGMAKVLAGAKAIVAVDTGLGHLAAALDVPTISLYGPTNPVLTGALGRSQVHMSAKFACAPCLSKVCTYRDDSSLGQPSPLYPPCFASLSSSSVWAELTMLL